MHKVSLPQPILDRVRAQRGGDHIFQSLDPARTAHVIVDMQRGFCDEGAPIEVPMTREIFGTINQMSAAMRAAGGTNLFLRYTRDPAEPVSWDIWFRNYLTPAQIGQQDQFHEGSHFWNLADAIEVQSDDLVVNKTRFSGLIPGTCAMDALLKARNIDTLIISGTLTNCCCESTARDALQMGYKVIFLTDANATLSDEEHNATLISMYTIFADVMSTPEAIALVAAGAPASAAA